MEKRLSQQVIGVLGVVAIGAVGAVALGSAPAAAHAKRDYAVVRGAHLSPDTPSVDVYLTSFAGGSSKLWLTSVGYGDVSPYRRLPAGLYAVSMRPAGAPKTSPVALRWTVDARAGDAFTVAAIGMNKHLHGIVLRDDLRAPQNGQGRVRVIQAASRAPHATVTASGGPVLANSAAFGSSTRYVNVPAGSWRVQAAAVGHPSTDASAALRVPAGSVTSLVVLDNKGSGITLRTLTDSAGARVEPSGAVPAGGGGTAGPLVATTQASWLGILAAVLAGLVALVVSAPRRRAGQSRTA